LLASQRSNLAALRIEGFTSWYVWRRHILEREDNEMTRPHEVVAGL